MTHCELCFHRCVVEEGQRGICRARSCKNGQIVCDNYGLITSAALDPIEKKPLCRFWPGKYVLSLGSYGCNLRCPFCQNSDISMSDGENMRLFRATPEQIARKSWELTPEGNIGVAYTYNEPTVGYEFVYDCARAVHELGLKNVLVTNGSLLREPLERLLPYIDAMNVDLKGFTSDYYRWLGGNLETVMDFIRVSVRAGCHVEVTTLIVPGKNDGEDEIVELSSWLADLDPEIPLHISRYFPRFRFREEATPVETVYRLAAVARQYLKYVYEGNC